MCGIGGDCLRAAEARRARSGWSGSTARAGRRRRSTPRRCAPPGHAAMPPRSAAAVTVPGAVDAFVRLAADWGRLGLAASLAPAIAYAEAGVPVAPRVARDWAAAAPKLLTGDARRHFLLDGAAPAPGQLFRAPGQAEVLRRIARDGRAGFYEGEVAEDMVALAPRARRHPHARRLRRHRLRLCRADRRQLPRPRARRAAAERPGRDRDPDGEDPRALRPRRARPARRRARASRGRGGQARLRRPRPLHRRPRRRRRCASTTCSPTRPPTRLAGADRPRPRAARARPRRPRRSTARPSISDRRRPRPHGGVDDLLDLPQLRLGPRLGPLRDQLPEPRRRLHA